MYEEAPDDIGGERCNNCRHAPLQSKNADDMRSCRKLLESSRNKFGSCHERRRRFEKKIINNNQKKGKSLTISRRSEQYSTQEKKNKAGKKIECATEKVLWKIRRKCRHNSKTIRNNSEENPATKRGSKSLSLSLSLSLSRSKSFEGWKEQQQWRKSSKKTQATKMAIYVTIFRQY